MRINNKNLPFKKSAIWFKPYTQKNKNNEYFVLFFYYNYQTLIDLGAYARFRKTWTKISFQSQDCIVVKKYILKQVIMGVQKRSKILLILNKYKDTLEDLVNSLDIEYWAIPK